MIFIDTETTGLIIPGIDDPDQQPRIIEFAAVSWAPGAGEVAAYSTLVNPGVPVPPEVTKITGLTDASLADAPPFAAIVPELVRFFRADPDNAILAHNLAFDLGMLVFELRRSGWEHRFPFCWTQTDTVPLSGGKRLERWAEECGVLRSKQTHRALDDVRLLIACYDFHLSQLGNAT